MIGLEAKCEYCDLIFEKKKNNQRYCCPECSKAGRLRKSRDYHRAERLAKQKQKENKKPTLSDINQRARAAGMTYGKYMAQEYSKQVKVERRKENV